jgi:16S rRNA (cytosine1402-N4)-methyltransferase
MSTGIFHIPVMAEPAVAFLLATPSGPIVDATLGGGGHTSALLAGSAAERHVIAVDQDLEALAEAKSVLEHEGTAERCTLIHGNFRDLPSLLPQEVSRHGVSGILADLGVSSHQLDAPARGFGLKHSGAPLDMRMNPSSDTPTAAELIEHTSVDELARTLRDFGEVQGAHRLARAMKEALNAGRLETTRDLAELIEQLTPVRGKRKTHPATTVFQALRIAVNGELDALDELLEGAAKVLKPGGRLAIMSYHSLEDRRVKHTFRLGQDGPPRPGHLPPPSDWEPTWSVLTSRPVNASETEIASNPRARSARLRVAERTSGNLSGGAR